MIGINMTMEEAIELLGENTSGFIENFINKYNKKNRTTLVIKWYTEENFPQNVAVKYLEKRKNKRGKYIDDKPVNTNATSLSRFIYTLMHSQAIVRAAVKIIVRKSGGEKAFISTIKIEIAEKIARYLYQENDRFFMCFSCVGGQLRTTLHDHYSGQKVKDVSNSELKDIIEKYMESKEELKGKTISTEIAEEIAEEE